MNLRQQYEVRVLSKYLNFDIEKMSETFALSERMIRYDINSINNWLENYGLTSQVNIEDGIAFINENLKAEIVSIISEPEFDFYVNKITGDERVLFILFDLCSTDHPIRIKDLMDKYCVSRSTINNDLVEVKSYAQENDISFYSKRGIGIGIEEPEERRRKQLIQIVKDYAGHKNINSSLDLGAYSQWFPIQDLFKIKNILVSAENEFSLHLTDVALEALLIHVALSMQRCQMGDCYKRSNIDINRSGYHYKVAEYIVYEVNEEFGISLPSDEVPYIAIHLCAQSGKISMRENVGNFALEYNALLMIQRMSELMNFDFNSDEKLYSNILQHLSACVYRNSHSITLVNPIKDEVIANYPKVYEYTFKILEHDDFKNIVDVNEDEVSYIALHFAASIHRIKSIPNAIEVAIVCSTGIGTAEILASELQKNFNLNIKAMLAKHQVEGYLKNNKVDLIISTLPLSVNVDYIVCSPIPKDVELEVIFKKINDLGFMPTKNNKSYRKGSLAAEIEQVLLLNSSVDDEILRTRIMHVLDRSKDKVGQYMLSDLLNEKTIQLQQSCESWQEAIRLSGAVLRDQGFITDEYIDNAIATVKEVGPYIVITKGVALPHSTNKTGVNRTCMSLLTLDTPVNFNNPDNDPVYNVFMLATEDADSHIGALKDLAEFLERKEFLTLLSKARNPQEIISYIRVNETNF